MPRTYKKAKTQESEFPGKWYRVTDLHRNEQQALLHMIYALIPYGIDAYSGNILMTIIGAEGSKMICKNKAYPNVKPVRVSFERLMVFVNYYHQAQMMVNLEIASGGFDKKMNSVLKDKFSNEVKQTSKP